MKKKFIFGFLSLTILLLITLSCTPPPAAEPTSGDPTLPKVLVVESFLADITRNIAGDRLSIETLMPLGADPHAFEPSPRDIAHIADSTVLVINGAGFEGWLAETLENAGGQRLVIEAAANLQSRGRREGEEAVMSPQEKADALCVDLEGKQPQKKVLSGGDLASAVDLNDPADGSPDSSSMAKLYTLTLNPQSDANFGGTIIFTAAESDDYILAASQGTIEVQSSTGAAISAEEELDLSCAGLQQAQIIELEAGNYLLTLRGFDSATTTFLAGPSGVHQHQNGDPHFWLDPNNVIHYAENIRDGLTAADPAGKEIYLRNAADYIAQLKALDAEIQTLVEQIPSEKRLIVTNHESFGYFADRYGFTIIGTVIPSVSTDSSPSAQQLARLIDHIRETGASALFLETGTNPRLAEQIAVDTSIRVVTGLHTHSLTKADGLAPTYIEMMRDNTRLIVEALR